MRLFLVNVGYACYGIEVDNGRVVSAPPIARWMIGKPEAEVIAWLRAKGGTWEEVRGQAEDPRPE